MISLTLVKIKTVTSQNQNQNLNHMRFPAIPINIEIMTDSFHLIQLDFGVSPELHEAGTSLHSRS